MGDGKQAQGLWGLGEVGWGEDRWGHWNIPEIGYQGELPWGQCSGHNVKTGS